MGEVKVEPCRRLAYLATNPSRDLALVMRAAGASRDV